MKDNLVVKKSTPLGVRTWSVIILFTFIGQMVWIVENLYFSTFIQKNITADAWATSATVAASAIAANLGTIFGGAILDRTGKRKVFITWGYIAWGFLTASFAIFGNNQVAGNITVAVMSFVVMDCIMSIVGAFAVDSSVATYITDNTDITNRSFVETIASLAPVFGGFIVMGVFDPFTKTAHWSTFFIIVGVMASVTGVIGLFLIKDKAGLKGTVTHPYLSDVITGFRSSFIKENKALYGCLWGIFLSSVTTAVYFNYIINILELTLGFESYVLLMACSMILPLPFAVIMSKLMDKYGREKYFTPMIVFYVLGNIISYCTKYTTPGSTATFWLIVIGTTIGTIGSMMAVGLFHAGVRDFTPKGKEGCAMGLKMIFWTILPTLAASVISPLIINIVKLEPTAEILARYPSYIGHYLYPHELFLTAAFLALFLIFPSLRVKKAITQLRIEKLTSVEYKDQVK